MTNGSSNLERVLVLEMVRVTEAAAIAASTLVGRGDEKAADAAAVEAMREALNELYMDGTVVIGEGERDEAPMLFIGEKVGRRSARGRRSTSRSIRSKAPRSAPLPARIARGAGDRREGGLLNAPDVYMDKIAIGPGYPAGLIDLDKTPTENITRSPPPRASSLRRSSPACSIARAMRS
jgi:fructose-1,6-bisphosphatase II / sedoheptulose-1,7-bisphosphatase